MMASGRTSSFFADSPTRHPESGGDGQPQAGLRVRGSCAKTKGPAAARSRPGPPRGRQGSRADSLVRAGDGRSRPCGPSLTPEEAPSSRPARPRRSGPSEPASTGRPSMPLSAHRTEPAGECRRRRPCIPSLKFYKNWAIFLNNVQIKSALVVYRSNE